MEVVGIVAASEVSMKKIFSWWSFLAFVFISTLFGFAGSRLFQLNIWFGILITAGIILLLGVLAIVEDWLPGGFNNPKRSSDKKK
jgi:hypothetical protein